MARTTFYTMKNVYIRTSVFTVIRSIVYAIALLVTGFIVGKSLSALTYAIIFGCVYAVLTFIFAEWIFLGERLRIVHLIGVVVLGYLIDTIVTIALFSWYFDRNMFLEQTVQGNIVFALIYSISMIGGYVLKKRMAALRGGLAEGLA